MSYAAGKDARGKAHENGGAKPNGNGVHSNGKSSGKGSATTTVLGALMVVPTFAVAVMYVPFGLGLAIMTAVGNSFTDVGQKIVGKANIGSALQIAVTSLLTGLITLGYLLSQGEFTIPNSAFWAPALGSAVLNAMAKTLQTKAYNESDISLCAPFNA